MARAAARAAASAALFGAASLWGAERCDAAVLRPRAAAAAAGAESATLESYHFDRFLRDFAREDAPQPGSKEYGRRAALFQTSLDEVREVNARNAREGRLWRAGVHPFMDWTPAERVSLHGYKPPPGGRSGRTPRSSGSGGGGVSLLHSASRAFLGRAAANATLASRATRTAALGRDVGGGAGGLARGEGPALRNQGACGSCWAISAVEAVEAQLQRAGAAPPGGLKVSAQALIDCVPNPQHCGGSGGCAGATGELAYAFIRDYGIPLEAQYPYQAKTHQCGAPAAGASPAGPRVRIGGWNQLPSNKAGPLMQAIAEQGPVVVAVDAQQWFNYASGIFDGCDKDAVLGHAVLAKGFGEEAGSKYWLIQNSWGGRWGEGGHIRLARREDEDGWCGVDRKPQEGVGCDGGPEEVTVCGTCGILYDPIVPTGVHLEAEGEGEGGHASGSSPAADVFRSDDGAQTDDALSLAEAAHTGGDALAVEQGSPDEQQQHVEHIDDASADTLSITEKMRRLVQ